MNETFQKLLTLLVVEDDPGDFGLIRAQVQLAGLARRHRPQKM